MMTVLGKTFFCYAVSNEIFAAYPLFYTSVNSLWLPKIIFHDFHNLGCLPNAKSDKK